MILKNISNDKKYLKKYDQSKIPISYNFQKW